MNSDIRENNKNLIVEISDFFKIKNLSWEKDNKKIVSYDNILIKGELDQESLLLSEKLNMLGTFPNSFIFSKYKF